MPDTSGRRIVVLLKGYPRLSETFIAQEILGLEQAGFDLCLVSMRRPTDTKHHPVHDEIRAPVSYLPEYLHEEPLRVLGSLWSAMRRPGFRAAFGAFARDLRRDPSRNRIRRFGQAAVLAREWPEGAEWLHAHFIHTPGSVARYTSLLNGVGWSCSAHAKDIWLSPDWDLTEKLAAMRWAVTCTRAGHDHLRRLAGGKGSVTLSYHGLDLGRFGPSGVARPDRDGSDVADPVRFLTVGRAVEKKGFDILLAALAALPPTLHWRLDHVGGGALTGTLRVLAERLGIADRVTWHGALDQREVLELYRQSDLFALACRIAADGDRDGLPNVIVEASSQGLATVSTEVSGVPELLTDGVTGIVVPPEDPMALARALEAAARDPGLRRKIGEAVERRVREAFDFRTSIGQLADLFGDDGKAER